MDRILSDPKAVAERGEKLYVEKFKKDYESPSSTGLFLAIDVVNEKAYAGRTPEEAYDLARKGSGGKGVFHLMRVGSAGAFRVGYSANGDISRLFRH